VPYRRLNCVAVPRLRQGLTGNSDTLQLWQALGSFRMTPIVSLSRVTGFALAAALAWVPLAGPVHVHESRGDGHQQAIIHRHSDTHDDSHHAASHRGVFEESHAQVRTLGSVFVIPDAPPGPSAPAVQAAPPLDAPIIPVLHPIADHVELLIHGPPRAPAFFRGPPVSPAL
jgi:hypothetical protein